MVYRIVAACGCLALLTSAAALAQDAKTSEAKAPPPKVKTLEELTRDVQGLQQQLAAISANLTNLAKAVGDNVQETGQNQRAIEQNAENIARITDVIQTELSKQQRILEAISQKDSAGHDVLRLSAIMEQSGEFRGDMRKAVQQSLETHGDFSIHNRMATVQQVVVNQRPYRLNPDEILTLKVPVGTVTAQLPGQALTNWTVSAPSYSQRVEIVPDVNTRTVYRPVSGDSGVTSYEWLPRPWDPIYLVPLPSLPPAYVESPPAYWLPF